MQPDFPRLEQRLGIPLGMTLTALIAKAYEVAPSSPSQAFVAAGIRLRWIDSDFTATMDDLRTPSTPLDVLPIIETGTDLQHFGLLMRRGGFPFFSNATDRRSIVNVGKEDAEPFAKDLRSLLSIAATIGLTGVTRQGVLRESPVAPPAELAIASTHLTSIPGVRRARDLASMLDRRELAFAYAEQKPAPYQPPRGPSLYRHAGWALRDAKECLEHGYVAEALQLCEDGFQLVTEGFLDNENAPTPPTSGMHAVLKGDLVRSLHFVRLRALALLGDPKRNRDALLEAIDALSALPFVHAIYWMELHALMKLLGVVDPQLSAIIEARARTAESESL